MGSWFVGPKGLQALFADRILAFDEAAAVVIARHMVEGKADGRSAALDTSMPTSRN
jgi:hypothetical protein